MAEKKQLVVCAAAYETVESALADLDAGLAPDEPPDGHGHGQYEQAEQRQRGATTSSACGSRRLHPRCNQVRAAAKAGRAARLERSSHEDRGLRADR